MPYLILTLLLILALFLLFWQISNFISIGLGAPAVSSPKHQLWQRFAGPQATFLDLGCGIGSVVLAAAPHFKHVYGMEYSPFFYIVSRFRTRRHKNITILYGNILTADWPKTTAIYCYLMPALLEKLTPRFQSQSATVLSLAFPIPGLTPHQTIQERRPALYIYRFSPKPSLG